MTKAGKENQYLIVFSYLSLKFQLELNSNKFEYYLKTIILTC